MDMQHRTGERVRAREEAAARRAAAEAAAAARAEGLESSEEETEEQRERQGVLQRRREQGCMPAWPRCTTAPPLHTRFVQRIGASISEAAMWPNPRREAAAAAVERPDGRVVGLDADNNAVWGAGRGTTRLTFAVDLTEKLDPK
jgi:hypothetical protein